jgi:hypothetical protein
MSSLLDNKIHRKLRELQRCILVEWVEYFPCACNMLPNSQFRHNAEQLRTYELDASCRRVHLVYSKWNPLCLSILSSDMSVIEWKVPLKLGGGPEPAVVVPARLRSS